MNKDWLERKRKYYFDHSRINIVSLITSTDFAFTLDHFQLHLQTRGKSINSVHNHLEKMLNDKSIDVEQKVLRYYEYLSNDLLKEENSKLLELITSKSGEIIYADKDKVAETADRMFDQYRKEITVKANAMDSTFRSLQEAYRVYVEKIRAASNAQDESQQAQLVSESKEEESKIKSLIKNSINPKEFENISIILFEIANKEYHDKKAHEVKSVSNGNGYISLNDVKAICGITKVNKENFSNTQQRRMSIDQNKIAELKKKLEKQLEQLVQKLNLMLDRKSSDKKSVIDQISETRTSLEIVDKTMNVNQNQAPSKESKFKPKG